jgi:glycine/D-amino acid oxidase-like deaminating enzyme
MVRITVIGAGSAGLISALIIQNKHNSAKVTVIGSDKIPVIGVGESTVGSFGEVMRDHIGMDMNEFKLHLICNNLTRRFQKDSILKVETMAIISIQET